MQLIVLQYLQFIGACKDPLMVIVTELLPGMSLRKYLNSIRPGLLDCQVAINFALDVARAMDCLHANGIIHRDLKPGTIFPFVYTAILLVNTMIVTHLLFLFVNSLAKVDDS